MTARTGFDRDKAREIVSGWLPYPSGEPLELRLDALAGCFDAPTTDPRIARIEEFLHRAETQGDVGVIMPAAMEKIRKIIRGEDA